MPPSME